MNDVIEAAHTPTMESIRKLESVMKTMHGQLTEDELTSHHFCGGMYGREFFLPAGGVAVGKTHAKECFFLIVAGDASISTADGSIQRVHAPYMPTTKPGSKRVVAAHTDTIFLTFHPNPDDERDLIQLEQRFIIPEALPAPEAKELLE